MTRFFVHPDQIVSGEVILDADDAHHLRAVLKSHTGDVIAALDGLGNEFKAVLTEVGKTHARARITETRVLDTECRVRVTIAQALPKMAEKMEQVLQRGTEAGAAAFCAYSSTRSLPHLTAERHTKRIVRWQQIIKTAAEQSHRAQLPTLRADQSFADILREAASFDLALFAFEGETDTTLRHILESADTQSRFTSPEGASREPCRSGHGRILIVIGPEGGFVPEEVRSARKHGLKNVSLGPRILRTETAALVMLSQIIYALEY